MKQTSTFLLLIIAFTCIACEKVIQVKTNNSEPQLVIEGIVSNDAGPYSVKLSTSINYNEVNTFPAVSNAQVIISDNVGNTETLKETSAGIYQTTSLKGTPGREYTLFVKNNTKEYTASSRMPEIVPIQRLQIVRSLFSFNKADSLDLNCIFTDPPLATNFYRLVQTYNGRSLNTINLLSDKYINGNTVTYTLGRGDSDRLKKDDFVQVLLGSLDQASYNYFNTLNSIVENNGGQTASPANPVTNIKGGALGYFSAFSYSRKDITVP